ncbi:protein ecdysoneless homolog [Littorina saxatilis]|uniref:Ecdysoneless n=1 Tax=Littorina saxatilis TaxID=31220 RepID=A0AAN9BWG8_9CAEN
MAGFPQARRLPEDVLEYLLIPQLPERIEEDNVVPSLERISDSYLGHIGPMVIDYIWQNEGFTLKTVAAQGDIPPHLVGRTNFGDNIEDEWFIVYLLYELSKSFSDLVIRVSDNDEEFLLIEAADHLPKLLNPETAENRVYIYGGKLHIIPMPHNPGQVSAFPLFTPTVEEAVALIRNPALDTCASQPIQECLSRRLERCRAKLVDNTHYANTYVPVSVAALLKEKPQLVSSAVQAFYYRDPVELKVCRTMNHFKPENMVVTRVRFTRCLYAQLLQQKFRPDKHSGFMLPSASNPKFKEQDLGMKLSHGFEILCARCRSSSSNGSNNSNRTQHTGNMYDVRWSRFLTSLNHKGYFKGELEGSQLYKSLLENAKTFFLSQLTDSERNDSDLAREIVQMLPDLSTDVGPWKKLEKTLAPSDDDTWLDLTPDNLDAMLQSSEGQQGSKNADASDVVNSMNAFINKVSSVDGVEFPEKHKGDEDGEGDVDLDGTSFIHAMQKIFDFKDDDDGSSSEMSEYDWEENSDDDMGHQERTPGTRPAMPTAKPVSLKPQTRPTSKPPARPAKPPALPPKPPARPSKAPKQRKDPEVVAIMEAMDRELAQTEVGKSFERDPPRPKPLRFDPKPKARNTNPTATTAAPTSTSAPPTPSSSGGASKLVSRPAKPTASRPSRPPPPVPRKTSSSVDVEDEDDDFRPVSIDINVVKNTLESLRAQQGLPGPASNILQSMGIALPTEKSEPGAH